jgi:hypothetical protein
LLFVIRLYFDAAVVDVPIHRHVGARRPYIEDAFLPLATAERDKPKAGAKRQSDGKLRVLSPKWSEHFSEAPWDTCAAW